MPCVLIRSSSSAISPLKASACRWRRAGGGDLLEPGDVYRVVRGRRRVYFGMSVYYPCRPFWRTSSGRIGALCSGDRPLCPRPIAIRGTSGMFTGNSESVQSIGLGAAGQRGGGRSGLQDGAGSQGLVRASRTAS
jgi:hypothetical protein